LCTVVSKKAPSVAALKTRLGKAGVKAPDLGRMKDLALLEHGMVYALLVEMTARQAEASVRSLRGAYEDWNEVRVSQIQEIAPFIKSKSTDTSKRGARLVKAFLQDVFQNNHSFDLSFVLEDIAAGGKAMATWPVLGVPGAHYLMWVATEGLMPVTAGIVRVFDRIGLMERTTSYKKGLEALSKLGSPKGKPALQFAMQFGEVAERWCDSRKPLCHACPLVEVCPYGKKVFQDWKVTQERLAVQRAREEEREQKRLEVEGRRIARQKEREKKLKASELKKARAEQARRKAKAEAEVARKAAAKKAVADKKAAAKRAAAAKKAAAKKKAAKKKAPKKVAKKPAAKKVTKKVTKKVAKKTATKKAAKKTAKKKATKKKATKKR
jgi:endonuclease III